MRARRAIGHAMTELGAHPGRALLSGFSLLIGVVAVIAIVTMGHIVDEGFVAISEQSNGRAITVRSSLQLPVTDRDSLRAAMSAGDAFASAGGGYAITITPEQRTAVAGHADNPGASPLVSQPVVLVAGDPNRVRRLPVLSGRWFDSRADLPMELVVNLSGAGRWGGSGTLLTVSVTPDQPPIRTRIVGVIADGAVEPNLYLPLLAVLQVRPTSIPQGPLELTLHHPNAGVPTLRLTAERIAAAAGGRLQVPAERFDDIAALRERLRTQQSAFLAIAVLALFIAALGILNIGLASVAERARELVIRRAVGASRLEIMSQMLLSAMMVGLVAAAIAVALAVTAVQWWLPTTIDPVTAIEPPGFPWYAAIWGLAAALATTLAGGAAPAIAAARLDVANALRD